MRAPHEVSFFYSLLYIAIGALFDKENKKHRDIINLRKHL